MAGRITVYTTAPAAYDYGYMRNEGKVGTYYGSDVRRVTTEDQDRLVGYQIPRYRSGMYAVWEPDSEVPPEWIPTPESPRTAEDLRDWLEGTEDDRHNNDYSCQVEAKLERLSGAEFAKVVGHCWGCRCCVYSPWDSASVRATVLEEIARRLREPNS